MVLQFLHKHAPYIISVAEIIFNYLHGWDNYSSYHSRANII